MHLLGLSCNSLVLTSWIQSLHTLPLFSLLWKAIFSLTPTLLIHPFTNHGSDHPISWQQGLGFSLALAILYHIHFGLWRLPCNLMIHDERRRHWMSLRDKTASVWRVHVYSQSKNPQTVTPSFSLFLPFPLFHPFYPRLTLNSLYSPGWPGTPQPSESWNYNYEPPFLASILFLNGKMKGNFKNSGLIYSLSEWECVPWWLGSHLTDCPIYLVDLF